MANKNKLNLSGYTESFHRGSVAQNNANAESVLTENMYFRVLMELAVNRFSWHGLPDSVDPRFLEMELYYSALGVFYFNNDVEKYLVSRAAGVGGLNHYDNHTSFRVYMPGTNRNTFQISGKNCVPIYANYARTPDHDIVYLYAKKLARIDRTIDINTTNLRQTKILVANETERLTVSNINRAFENGEPAIHVAKGFDITQAVQAIDLAVNPETLPKLLVAREKLWNNCMTLLGINNSNQDKAERLVSDEVSANDEQVRAVRAVQLRARREAAHLINKKYNLNITVDYLANEDQDVSPYQLAMLSNELEENETEDEVE